MSTTPKHSLLLALVVGSLVGPASAAAKPIYEPGNSPSSTASQTHATLNANRPAASYYTVQALRAMGARGQAQAEFYANPAASHYTAQALRAMGARGQAQGEFYATPSAKSLEGTSTEATGDRWGADAYASGSVASHGTRAAASQSASNNKSNVLGYILGAMAILLAGTAVLLVMGRRFHADSKQRIAIP